MPALIECVPNFSNGRDPEVIRRITARIEATPGATLLHIDPGAATNRTVVTFAGAPAAVIEAAFQAIAEARDLIDMRSHSGEHPRMGATDVCPLVPLSGISLEETAEWSHKLAERVGRELEIPVYLYEAAQPNPARRNLSVIRAGEYEGLEAKMKVAEWKPDYGPTSFNPKSGATVIGARGFLVAYNVNLNTTSTRRANAVAFDVREAGRPKREGDPLTGKVVNDAQGNPVMIPGTLKAVKAIGWYIEEYQTAQVSMNLADISVTPLHRAFDEVCRSAEARGMRVTGSELVGLVPLSALTEAGRHYLAKQQRSRGVSEPELIKVAVDTLGLNQLAPFKPEERIIEYRIRGSARRPERSEGARRLGGMTLSAFTDETASESAAPGGGSIAAAVGAFGAALGTMVANLSAHKRGWDDRWEEFSAHAEQGQAIKNELVRLVDADTEAFNKVMAAMGLPKNTAEEKETRKQALNEANRGAIEVPFQVMHQAIASFPLLEAMARDGNPASVSDAGVGALCARTAVHGAWLNVKINLAGLGDPEAAKRYLAEGEAMVKQSDALERAVLAIVESKMK
jgi:glutamate formiminotransferase/formiminotetrahydrofolate cyclodeaminase